MQFILTKGWEEGIDSLTTCLVQALSSGQPVLWLVSGGSNLNAAVEIMNNIPEDLTGKLTVMPIDERYGPASHADSNTAQLLLAGFQAKDATVLDALLEGKDFTETIQVYEAMTHKALRDNEVVIAQIGMGADGHIAGILPDSPATQPIDSLICGYDSPPYKRMTLTFNTLKRVNVAFVFAFGEAKLKALKDLRNRQLSLAEQPAQILKQLDEVHVYNDQLGDTL